MMSSGSSHWFSDGMLFGFGALVGSFLNVVIHRLPIMLQRSWEQQCVDYLKPTHPSLETLSQGTYNLAVPRSHCLYCQTNVPARYNIPLFSYFWLRGKTACCGQRLSPLYPLVEWISALATVFMLHHFGWGIEGLGSVALCWGLIALFFIDCQHHLLPDIITLPLLWLGLLLNSLHAYTDLNSALWGAVLGYALLWSVYWLFKLSTQKEGMGHGDFKLLSALGAWLGWQALPGILLWSSCAGILYGIYQYLLTRKSTPFAFGPFLVVSGLLNLLQGPPLLGVATL